MTRLPDEGLREARPWVMAPAPQQPVTPAKHRALWHQALAAASHDIVQGTPSRLSIEQARLLQLGPWCYLTAAAGSVWRQQLAADFARYWQTQQQRAALLVPVLAAWQQAGLRAVLMKGMAMAWGAYAHPALRHCSDIDVLMSPADAARARQLHLPGWHVIDTADQGAAGREVFSLVHEASGCCIDAQQALLPPYGFAPQAVQNLTQAVLQSATPVAPAPGLGAAAAPVLLPQPADLLLILAVNRAWTADAWQHKPHDYLDMQHTIERHGLTPQALLARADELGLRSTWLAFLTHCNPFERRFDLVACREDRWAHLRKECAVVYRGLPMRVHAVLDRARRAPAVLQRACQAAPVLLRVLADLRRYPTPQQASAAALPAALEPLAGQRPVRWPLWQLQQASHWAQRLLKPLCKRTAAGPCVVHSLTLFRLLQQHGYAARWCLGYRAPGAEGPQAHAWVDVNDPYAFGLACKNLNDRYHVVFQSPPQASPSTPSTTNPVKPPCTAPTQP